MAPIPGDSSKHDAARGPSTPSLDHLIGGGKERRRYGEPQHAGGFGVDDEFELRRLHHGQVRGLRALENATYIAADLAISVDDIGPIANQSADFRKNTLRVCCGKRVARR